MLYRLRDAMAKKAPEVIAAAIVDLAVTLAKNS